MMDKKCNEQPKNVNWYMLGGNTLSNSKGIFTTEQIEAYERLSIPMAVFQFVNNIVITLLVSDGLCEMVGTVREQLINQYDSDMFGRVHPDDIEMLAEMGYRFARDLENYDVTYRTKLYGKDEFRLVHATGKYQVVGQGIRVAFLTYTDVTDIKKNIIEISQKINDPKVNFFYENLGPMIVISQADKRLLYYNQAICRIIPPKAKFDSGITFQQFFYPDFPEGIKGLMDVINSGPRVVEEPYTQRELEVSVIASSWNKESVYVIYFYEVSSDSIEVATETIQRHQRMAFNNVMFAAKQNDFSYSLHQYRGFHIWNLTKNEVVYHEEYNALDKQDYRYGQFDEYFHNLKNQCLESDDKEFLEICSRKNMLLLYQLDKYPRTRIINLQTSHGMIYVSIEIIMMQSPDTGDIYIKVWEENITDKEIIRRLASKAVEQEYDYMAYIDVLADYCWMLHGKKSNFKNKKLCIKVSDYSESGEFLQNLEEILNKDFKSVNEIVEYILVNTKDKDVFSTVHQMRDGKIKRLYIQIIDKNNLIFYFKCSDVTELLFKEKCHGKELKAARNEALEANKHLQAAVQAEREKVEAILVQTILAVSNALDAKDAYTSQHSERVAKYASAIAGCLKWEKKRIDNIYNISLVHDIGKIGIPDALLMKTTYLTSEEYEIIKQHVKIGSNILKDFTAIDKIYEGILYHHERYDGSGYVFGLKGEEIPIEARIIAIADSVDAMYSTRPYREKQSMEFIKNELIAGKGKQFDPVLVDIMIDLMESELLERKSMQEKF
jgi:HD-GYP domain-containing protein (c-di-GMP phosphodiesterase class II)/PAS domain-containing protein